MAATSWLRIFTRVFGVGLMVVGALFVTGSILVAFPHVMTQALSLDEGW